MRAVVIVLSIAAVAVLACTATAPGGGRTGDPEPSSDDELTMPPRSDPLASYATKSGAAGQRTVTGVLGFDDVEGGCFFLEATDGTRYEVVYPSGWLVDRAAAELRGPGDHVLRVGEPVTVRGSIARERSSTCQIGPILLATDVQIP